MKPTTFRIYTQRGRRRKLYYKVRIFPDVDKMREYWTNQGLRLSGMADSPDWEARATGWAAKYRLVKSRWKKSSCVGEVLFHAGNLGSGIVSHEMTHAAHYLLHRKWAHYNTPYRDEQLAWLQGWLVWQFWTNYYRLFPHQTPVAMGAK